ncbi:MAG: 50S ribosomal protein L4 [Christensenella sp.]|nr:50S ribosomal protein L4 [Christensenella sp.]
MPNVSVYKTDGTQAGTIELSDAVFGIEINETVMHDAVVAHLANKRQGTQSALTRSEVRGGGIKPFRQKGTGRARQGTIRAPQMTHGGIVFAPKPRSYDKKLNKKVRELALLSALSQKVKDEDIIVMEDLAMQAPKTKEMAAILKNVGAVKALIVTGAKDDAVVRAAANIQGVKTTIASTLSVYDILKYEKFIITKDAVKAIEEVYA